MGNNYSYVNLTHCSAYVLTTVMYAQIMSAKIQILNLRNIVVWKIVLST